MIFYQMLGQRDLFGVYASLLPDVWKKTHPEAIRVYSADERQDKAERKQLGAAQSRTAAK